MKKNYSHEICVILLGSLQLVPLLGILTNTLLGIVIGFAWMSFLGWFWSSTIIGRRFIRAWYDSTIIIERALLGGN
jgi:hypothetical protein